MFSRDKFELLTDKGMKDYYPELFALKGVPQDLKWHPEGDAYEHTMCVLDRVNKIVPHNVLLQCAAVCHDLGKALTPKEDWPKQHGHAFLGIKPTRSLLKRVCMNEQTINDVAFITEYHMHVHYANVMRAVKYSKIFWEAYKISNSNLKEATNLLHHLCLLGAADHYGRGNVTTPATNAILMDYVFVNAVRDIDLALAKESKYNMHVFGMHLKSGKHMLDLVKEQ